jgi:hypothetical protein
MGGDETQMPKNLLFCNFVGVCIINFSWMEDIEIYGDFFSFPPFFFFDKKGIKVENKN